MGRRTCGFSSSLANWQSGRRRAKAIVKRYTFKKKMLIFHSFLFLPDNNIIVVKLAKKKAAECMLVELKKAHPAGISRPVATVVATSAIQKHRPKSKPVSTRKKQRTLVSDYLTWLVFDISCLSLLSCNVWLCLGRKLRLLPEQRSRRRIRFRISFNCSSRVKRRSPSLSLLPSEVFRASRSLLFRFGY